MYYYEVRALVTDEEGKIKNQSFVTQQSSYDLAGAVTDAVEGCERVTSINEKNFVDVFINAAKDFFYEIKVEWLNIEGKVEKETYLQQENSTKEAEAVLLDRIENEPEVVGTKRTNIKAYLN